MAQRGQSLYQGDFRRPAIPEEGGLLCCDTCQLLGRAAVPRSHANLESLRISLLDHVQACQHLRVTGCVRGNRFETIQDQCV